MIDFIFNFIFITVLLVILLGIVIVPQTLTHLGYPILGFLSFPFFIAGIIAITECLFW